MNDQILQIANIALNSIPKIKPMLSFPEILQLLTLISGFVISYLKITSNVKKNIKSVDAMQNEKIEKIESSINKMNDFIDNQNFNKKLHESIDLAIFSIIENNSNLDNAFKSLLIEGGNEAYYYFKKIRENGYENINIKVAELQGVQIFRKLRSGVGGNINLNKELKDIIKNQVAIPSLQNLITKLVFLKKGTYNGGSDKRFLEIATGFVSEIANNSISVLRIAKNKAS